jgi:hypothetical protein
MSLEYDLLPKSIECYPASIIRKRDIEKIFDDCVDAGNCYCAFGTSRKRYVKIIGENQIVDGFSTQYAIMDL